MYLLFRVFHYSREGSRVVKQVDGKISLKDILAELCVERSGRLELYFFETLGDGVGVFG